MKSGSCCDINIAAKIDLAVPGKYVARSESGKMARVLCDKLQEMKEKYSHFERRFQKKKKLFLLLCMANTRGGVYSKPHH